MSATAIDLRTNFKLPPDLKCAQRIGEVIGLGEMLATFDPEFPGEGEVISFVLAKVRRRGKKRGLMGKYGVAIVWHNETRRNTQDRTLVPGILFHVKAEHIGVTLEWFIAKADIANEREMKRFAQGAGNSMLDKIHNHLCGIADIAEKGHWTDDEDIRVENIQKAVEGLKQIEKKDEESK